MGWAPNGKARLLVEASGVLVLASKGTPYVDLSRNSLGVRVGPDAPASQRQSRDGLARGFRRRQAQGGVVSREAG